MGRTVIFLVMIALTAMAVARDLEQVLADQVRRTFSLDSDYVTITLQRTDLSRRDLTGCEVKVYPLTQAEPKGRFSLRVELLAEGRQIETGTAVLEIRRAADLWVPTRTIQRGEILSPELFTVKRIDVTSITEPMLNDLSHRDGCRAKQLLIAGRPVPLGRLEKVPDVENGTPVTLIGAAGCLEIQARGIALQNGYVGEIVKVKNIDSRKILTGRVTSAATVAITW